VQPLEQVLEGMILDRHTHTQLPVNSLECGACCAHPNHHSLRYKSHALSEFIQPSAVPSAQKSWWGTFSPPNCRTCSYDYCCSWL